MNEKVEYLFDDGPKKKNKYIMFAFILALLLSSISLYFWYRDETSEATSPIISLSGDSVIVLEKGDTYIESGYTANDIEDGDLTNKVKVEGNVDTNKPDIYTITYTVKDGSRNKTSVKRTIIIKSENSNIKFKLNGSDFILLEKGSDFIDEGYSAKDGDKDISSNVSKLGDVDLSKEGTYNLVYAIKNKEEVSTLTRRVIVYEDGALITDEELIQNLKNTLINEMHQNNVTQLNNVSESGLLAMAFKNCENDGTMTHERLTTCLKELFGINRDVPNSVNYSESPDNSGIHYDETSELWYDSKDNYGLGDKVDVIATLTAEDNIYLYVSYFYNPYTYGNDFSCENGETLSMIYGGYDKTMITGHLKCDAVKIEPTCEVDCEYRYDTTLEYNPTIYKHSFKKVNSQYIWQSSEIVK